MVALKGKVPGICDSGQWDVEKRMRSEAEPTRPHWHLALYIDEGQESRRAVETAVQLCEQLPVGHCRLEVFNVRENPNVAQENSIMAVPTLERLAPAPKKRLVGSGSIESLKKALDMKI